MWFSASRGDGVKKRLNLRLGAFPRWQALVFLAASVFVAFLACAYLAAHNFLPLSMADFYVYFSARIPLVQLLLVLFFVIFLQTALQHDFEPEFVTRTCDRVHIWNQQCIKAVVYAVVYAFFISICLFVAASRYSVAPIQWDIGNSVYFLEVEAINTWTSFFEVATAFLCSYILVFAGTALAMFVAWWGFSNPYAPWIGVIFVVGWDLICRGNGLSVLITRVQFSFTKWHAGQIWLNLLVAMAFCLVLYLIGRFAVCRHKEFYR